LSDAPHAAGVSAGLSEPPHAVPQAETAVSSAIFVHPNKLESAILYDLPSTMFGEFFRLSVIIIIHTIFVFATTHFFITRLQKGNRNK
jgi:hypothetical protein